MKPTVGRVVYFYDVVGGSIQPNAALITAVWNDDCVNLVVFHPSGGMFFKTSVMNTPLDLEQHPDLDKKVSMVDKWGWMPFQKGQAAKTPTDYPRIV